MTKVIGIIGVSYCGSTLLSFILDSLARDVVSVGEIFSLLNPNTPKKEYYCSCCRTKNCKYINEDFVKELNNSNIYKKFIESFNATTLIISQKGLWTMAHPIPDDLECIVMFKRPESSIKSFMVHERKTFSEAMDTYLLYGKITNFAKKYRSMYLSYEEFTKNIESEILKICKFFHLPYNENALRYWEFEHHQCEGNIGAHINILGFEFWKKALGRDYWKDVYNDTDWYRKNYRSISTDMSWNEYLTDEQKTEIKNSSNVQEIYNGMMEKLI